MRTDHITIRGNHYPKTATIWKEDINLHRFLLLQIQFSSIGRPGIYKVENTTTVHLQLLYWALRTPCC